MSIILKSKAYRSRKRDENNGIFFFPLSPKNKFILKLSFPSLCNSLLKIGLEWQLKYFYHEEKIFHLHSLININFLALFYQHEIEKINEKKFNFSTTQRERKKKFNLEQIFWMNWFWGSWDESTNFFMSLKS